MKTEEYFKNLKEGVDEIYSLTNQARGKGFDPVDSVEIPLAMSMAEKVVGLISTIYPQMMHSGITERILEFESEYGKLDPTVVFKIADEISDQKFCKFSSILKSIDAGIRVGMAYSTLGVVSSPIEGYTGIEIGKTQDKKDYLVANFSGPIRSAGTTASCLALILIDFLREKFGFAKYDPTEKEIKRVWSELSDFHERITNLQYMPTEEETLFLAKHMPIQVAGDPSEKLEVSNYKNLDRVNTNYLRSGFCLVMAEGLAQKAAKGYRLLDQARKNGIKCTGFDFLPEYIEIHEKRTLGKDKKSGPPTYIKDLVAGRPIYGHPSRSGGFRFRYGRGRSSGFSAVSVHPATMAVTDGFLAIGTQLKIEKPTKGCAVTTCDEIEGPIVKLKNGSVIQLKDSFKVKKLYSEIEEILYLGDLLFPFSDLLNRNANLIVPGYVEEWWNLELIKKGFNKTLNYYEVPFESAVELSEKYGVPLHPKYIYYWTQISIEEFSNLYNWIKSSWVDEKLVLPFSKKEKEIFSLGKRALELLGIPHQVIIENVVLDKESSKAILFNLGLESFPLEKTFLKEFFSKELPKSENVLEIVNSLSKFEIKDKAGEFIGARMGRPEKAKLRKLIGSPNVLFPVGNQGGRLRSVEAACEVGYVKGTFPLFYCENCAQETVYRKCEKCFSKTKQKYYFSDIKEKSFSEKVEYSQKVGQPYLTQKINIQDYFNSAKDLISFTREDLPPLIKGVRGLSSESKIPEHLSKGILRAKYNLQVNKDGTIRMDATELPLVSFRPREIGTSVSKLRDLGYDEDIEGNPLENEDQIIELMPHDVLIPSAVETPDEKGEDIFKNICNFIDELLQKVYSLPAYYKIKTKEDLIGKLGVCMAPHNCAGVICRFIGFSKTLGLLASPYMHAAIRRDCDGDEAAIMLLGDVLLNFSRKFLPSHRGGTQDAPLVLNAKIDAGEVDDQILDFEVTRGYPLELYNLAEKRVHSSKVNITTIRKILKEGKDPFRNLGFTHNTRDINEGVVCSSYKLLENMEEKVKHQMELVEKLRSVDTADTARLIIDRHFIRDMRGNLRKFSMQEFRCVKCNEIMRRPPLSGKCVACGGKIIFTIHEGGIKKYLEPALNLAKKYNLSPYLQQNLSLIKGYIDSIFGKELEKQKAISDFL
ncbi:DNA polymerase II large subunit [Candidatus Pacearchaeota archaeon CG_4_10_14_0_2_um_filter_30_11]|nr:MAG: DNA polymerase II large subunit [Candidatus Pacearchaeota archaeon CG_4_10_14_0_2_um_filter_30_11]